jgi:hypothetical protein
MKKGRFSPAFCFRLKLLDPFDEPRCGLVDLMQSRKNASPPCPKALPGARPTLARSIISMAALTESVTPSTPKNR